jgi:rubredoxin
VADFLFLPTELKERAAAEGVTESELGAVINSCRSSCELVYDHEDETCTCHAAAGHIILWTRFKESPGGITIMDFYFNRTSVTGVLDESEVEAGRVSPFLDRYKDHDLLCIKCDEKLVLRKVVFKYMKQNYHAITYACPVCGLVFEPHEMIDHQRENIEKVLEGK